MKSLKRVVAPLLILVMLGSVVSPALAINTEQKVEQKIPTCPMEENRLSKDDIKVSKLENTNKTIIKTLNDEGVRKIGKKLKSSGFRFKNAKAYEIFTKDGNVIAVLLYYTNGSDTKTIVYLHNMKTGVTSIALARGEISIQGLTTCILGILSCVGACGSCAAICPPPPWVQCLACLAGCGAACGVAYCTCVDYCCHTLHNQWCCDHLCP